MDVNCKDHGFESHESNNEKIYFIQEEKKLIASLKQKENNTENLEYRLDQKAA